MEEIITSRKYRVLVDEVNRIWKKISFWKKASDVKFDDGGNAETKIGTIQGITSDVNGNSDDIAVSIKAVHDLYVSLNKLNSQLGGFTLVIDDTTGEITGYTTTKSNGVVFPFQ